MKLKLFDISELNLTEIKNPKVFEKRRFSPDGLFSLQIFGPILSYHCGCSKDSFKGPNYFRTVCPKCGVRITTSSERDKTYAKIKLPFKVFNPLFFSIITQGRTALKKALIGMLYYNKSIVDKDGNVLYKCNDLDEIKRFVFDYFSKNGKYEEIYQFLKENEKLILIDEILVIPPSFRPCNRLSESGVFVLDELNEKYLNIIKIVSQLDKTIVTLKDNELYLSNFKLLQKYVFELYEFVLDKLSKKNGLIRSNILGKRVDFSGRSVITPEPTLKLNECGLPYSIVVEILKPKLIPFLVSKRLCSSSIDALNKIEESLRLGDYRFLKEVQEYCQNLYCVLNRQPTLHRMSVLGFKIRVFKGETIRLHPFVCSPFNADFDGDAMAVYIPVTEESLEDVISKISIEQNLISCTNLQGIPRSNQDVVLGIYVLTKDEKPRTFEFKNTKLSEGRYKFNLCLPEDYEVIDKTITKTELNNIFDDLCKRYPSDVVIETLDKIKELGFNESTLQGYTLSLSDIYSEELIDYGKKIFKGKISEDLDKVKKDKKLKELLKKLPFSTFIESGSRGTWDQARQLVLSRGYVANSTNVVKGLVNQCFAEGLTPHNFFLSCYGTRKGLLDTAISTGDSGYLTRQLIYSSCFVELDEQLENCKTKSFLTIEVTDEKMAYSLIGRHYLHTESDGSKHLRTIKFRNYKDFIGQTLKLRSPIYCQSPKICKVCYGQLHKILHSNQIGIIATQAIGERSTQLVLRTFHISGAVQNVTDLESNQNQDVITGMTILTKLFHNPYNIFLSKKIMELKKKYPEDYTKMAKKLSIRKIDISPSIMVKMLYDIVSQYGAISLVHYEVLVSAMMWYGNTPWRLLENRKEVEPEYVSILKVPSRVSWLLSCAFSNLKHELVNGAIESYIDENRRDIFDPSLLKLFFI